MIDAGLEDAVLSQRDALEPWRILGDALEASGDPRGRLVGLMLANETKPALKLISAWKDWLKAHAATLVPAELDEKTLGWRRGFLSDATLPGARLLESIDHPSLRLLDHAVLEAGAPLAQLEGLRLPWRTVELRSETGDELDLRPLIHACPYLSRLAVRVPQHQTELGFDLSPTVTDFELIGGAPSMLVSAVTAFPALRSLTLTQPRLSPNTAQWERLELLGRLERLIIERAAYLELAPLLERGWPGRLGVRTDYRDHDVAHGVNEHPEAERESAWVIALPADISSSLRALAASENVQQLMVRSASVMLAGKRLQVHRVHAGGVALSLGGCAVAASKHSEGRALGFAASQTHHTAVAWVVKNGPARSSADLGEATKLFRRSVELLFGVDPGPLALLEVQRAIYGAPEQMLLGQKPDHGQPLPLVTDIDVVANVGYDEYGDEYDEDEEENEADYWAAEEAEEGLRQEELERGAAPVAMTSETESTVKAPLVLDPSAQVVAEVEGAADEEEDEDEEPFRDALDATLEDIWTQTPVERDEDLEEPVTRAYDEPEPVEGVLVVGDGEVNRECALCRTVASTAPCTVCGDPVCAACGDGEEAERLCFECER